VGSIPGHDGVAQDTAPKEGPRLVQVETYIRTYLSLFGGLAPLDAQQRLRGGSGQLFDTWSEYLAALGLPDHRTDIPRGAQANAMMVATFERLGIALCDRAVEYDLRGGTPRPVAERLIFAFELTSAEPTDAQFAERFDVLHRTFLGYPAALAPPERLRRFLGLYRAVVARRAASDGGASTRFSPTETGWATVCYGLIRHPEFHLY
jgi:hypothetical protein